MRRTFPVLAALLLLLGALAGCRSGRAEDPILQLSAEESLVQGKALLAQQKYARARPYFTHAFEVEPNSAIGREGLLLAADTYYQEGGTSNYVQAEAKYRDFLNRFPTSEQAPYVQFQIANSLAKRMEKPDRDQTVTRKALEAYRELMRIYPTSEYAAQAQEQITLVENNLAEHEFTVGRFYLRYGIGAGAAQRFELLLSEYPQYPNRDKVIYHLGLAYDLMGKKEDADKTFDRLRAEFPESPFLAEIPQRRAQT
ncbi:MAG TPA: outer membrane protein assembly factor BamD [Thermoanaerobaculia bacterium]|nr:outer membrane protein assembly factor BamD [Thermoanaerobaculia bacterium]